MTTLLQRVAKSVRAFFAAPESFDPSCDCYACTVEKVRADPRPAKEMEFGVLDYRLMRMFLCPMCGNKRCSRAANHRNPCNNSNAPGQKGSLYADDQS